MSGWNKLIVSECMKVYLVIPGDNKRIFCLPREDLERRLVAHALLLIPGNIKIIAVFFVEKYLFHSNSVLLRYRNRIMLSNKEM